jgi:hypothetical protein
MTTHIAPAKTTRCKAHLTDGTKLQNATIDKNGQVCGYFTNKYGTKIFVCGKLDGRGVSSLHGDTLTTHAPIDTQSVSWKGERGNVICPV